MKRLALLCLTHVISISPMFLALRKSAPLCHMSGHRSFFLPPNKVNPKNFFNHGSSFVNLIAWVGTHFPPMLLPIIPQELHEFLRHRYQAIIQPENQALRDFVFFIHTNPQIEQNITKIKETQEKINDIKMISMPLLEQRYISETNTFFAQSNYKNRCDLIQQKKKLESSLLSAIRPFFEKYNTVDIKSLAADNQKHIKQLVRLDHYLQCIQTCSLGLAATLPVGMLLTLLEELPHDITLTQAACYGSLLLSTVAAYKNINSSGDLSKNIEQQLINLEYIKKIIELRQGPDYSFVL